MKNPTEKINIEKKYKLFSEHWHLKIIAELNGQEVKLIRLKGEFVWRYHDIEGEH
jgi:hypothetical protein